MHQTVEGMETIESTFGVATAGTQHPNNPPDHVTDRDDHASRVRSWYLMAVNHPKWSRFIPAAREDEGYYIGGDLQWSKDGSFDSLNRLREKKRTHVSVNHIQSVVDVLIGFERQNRYDLKASPQGDEDEESARVLSMLMRFVQDQVELQEYESEAFGDGLIRGASALFVGIDWQTTDARGRVKVEKLKPGEDCLWDPYTKRYDLSDAKFIQRFRWGYVDDLKGLYPDHEARIDFQVGLLDAMFQPFLGQFSTDGGRGDAYGSVGAPNLDRLREEELFYDWRDRRLLVVETWYIHQRAVYQIMNKATGQISEVRTAAEAKQIVDLDPQNLTSAKRVLRKVYTSLVIPGANTTIYNQPTPFENDDEAYPIVPYLAKDRGEYLYGLVRNMKDPQLLENTRISQVVDILKQWANIRPLVPRGAVDDERIFEEHWSRTPIVYNAKHGAPTWFTPLGLEQVVRGLIEVAVQFKINLREITGINTDLLGQDTSGTAGNSGIAIARRQAQGQIIATIFFDNFKRTRKIVGQRLAKRIQQVFTHEQILRLVDDATGEPVDVLLNPAEAAEMTAQDWDAWVKERRQAGGVKRSTAGNTVFPTHQPDRRPLIVRSVASLRYDVVISESPSTPSARATALMALLELVGKMPSILPAVVDKIVALAEVPDKAEIIQRIRAIMTQAGIPTGEVPSLDGGLPVPGPTGPPIPGQASTGGLPPAAPPPVTPTPQAPGAALPATARPAGTSVPMRRTLALASGGVPVGPGMV